MHLAKSDSAQSVYHTQAEWELLLKAVSAPLAVEEESDEVEWTPEYEEEPESPRRSRRDGGITNEQIAETLSAFLALLSSMKSQAPAEVHIHPTVDVKLPSVEKTVVFERDERGRLTASKTTERPITE